MDEPRHCSATRRDGAPCAAPPSAVDAATGFCWAHNPAKRAARRAARAKGGRGKATAARRAARAKGGRGKATAARAEKLLPSHMRPVLGAVFAALRDVRSGTITPAQASAIASLAGAAVKVYQVGRLEERIADLEAVQEGRLTA